MTHVNRSSVRREVVTTRGEVLIVQLAPEGVWMREKGRRASSAYLLPYGVAFVRAATLAANAKQRPKKRTAKRARAKLDVGV